MRKLIFILLFSILAASEPDTAKIRDQERESYLDKDHFYVIICCGGETLEKIAQDHEMKVEVLKAFNKGLGSKTPIRKGRAIRIPYTEL